jgi:undecaprenyl-diphosphatase
MKQLLEQIKKRFRITSLSILILPALLLVFAWIFASLTEEIVYEKEFKLDLSMYKVVATWHRPWLTKFMLWITFFGSRAFLLPAYLVLIFYFLLFKRKTSTSLAVTGVALCGAAVLFLAKNIFRRERPSEPMIQKVTSFSYPSGHSFSAFTFAGIVLFLIWSKNMHAGWKWFYSVLLLLFAIIIAFSRVYLNVHFVSDVFAGLCLSIIWLTVCYYTLKKIGLIKRTLETD